MLIAFKISNFLSFSDEQSLSMIPSFPEEDDLIRIGKIRLLRKGVIFGANSSGKSNFIKAIAFGRRLVLEGLSGKDKNKFSKILSENKTKESLFEYTFFSRGRFFSYGFSFVLNEGRLVSEYLYEIDSEDNDKLLFSRSGNEFHFEEKLKPEAQAELEFLKARLEKEPNRLCTNIIAIDSKISSLVAVRDWFLNKTIVNFQDQEFLRLESSLMKNQAEFVRILKNYDTGISELGFRKCALEDLQKHGREIYERTLREINRSAVPFGIRLKDALYYFDFSPKLEVYEVYLRHGNSELEYEFGEESDGTKRMFDLIDILISPVPNAVYLIDEINRSIHPLLTEKYLLSFKKCLQERNVQLLFTTHEANLLRDEILRRDEVWFVEKQADASSKIFSLDIFRKENEGDLGKAYLSGRFGGIPFLDSGDE